MKWSSVFLCLALSACANKASPSTFPVTEADEYGVYEAMLKLDRTEPVSDELLSDAVLATDTRSDRLRSVFNREALAALQAAKPPAGQRVDLKRLHVELSVSDGGFSRRLAPVRFDSTGRFAMSGMKSLMMGRQVLLLVAAERTVDGHWGLTGTQVLGAAPGEVHP